MNKREKYKCPHCGKIINEVEVVILTWKRILTSAGLGVGCGLLVYPLIRTDALVGAVGAFIIGFVVVLLVWRGRDKA